MHRIIDTKLCNFERYKNMKPETIVNEKSERTVIRTLTYKQFEGTLEIE